jgi:hypothetical protein
MAELLVRVVSKLNPDDVYKDVKLTKRGDVIMVVPDGWGWSIEEKTNPDWRIVKWPSETVVNASTLLTPELPEVETTIPDPMLQRRGFYLNLDKAGLPQALKNFINDNTRAQWFFSIPANITIADLKTKHVHRTDPNVIG